MTNMASKLGDGDVMELLRNACSTGEEAIEAILNFQEHFLKASAKAGMPTEIRAPFDHICQGKCCDFNDFYFCIDALNQILTPKCYKKVFTFPLQMQSKRCESSAYGI